jgi:hypothetical protein
LFWGAKKTMSKKNLILFLAIAFPLSALAQSAIIITKSATTPLHAGAYHNHLANITGVNTPSAGANQTWDYSVMAGGPVRSKIFNAATSFSATAVVDTNGSESIGGGYAIKSGVVYDIDANGFFRAGGILAKQTFDLSSITGSNGDNLLIPAQVFTLHESLLKFPCTASTNWVSNTAHTLNFKITASSFFLLNTPAKKVVHVISDNSVAGWGKIKIPSSNKASIDYDVLLIKKHTITIDSFFLNGYPAPPAMLSYFGLIQGDSTIDYNESFYRLGSVVPLLSLEYGPDSTWSAPIGASYDADNVQSGIEMPASPISEFNVFPNPASENIILDIPANAELCTRIEIVNSLGQTMMACPFNNEIDRTIQLPSEMKPGLYFIRIKNSGGTPVYFSRLVISR